jgi:hypothetical protein
MTQRTTPEVDAEIVHLLRTTLIGTDMLGRKFNLSPSTITRKGTSAGLDMVARAQKIKATRRTASRDICVRSNLPETMTGDGLSLKWLSLKW